MLLCVFLLFSTTQLFGLRWRCTFLTGSLKQKDTEIQRYGYNCIHTNITTMSYRTKLLACAICGRKFQIARLKDHEDICRRVTENTKRRGVFNATRQRKVKGSKVRNRAKKTRRATMNYDKQRRAREKEKRRLRNARKARKVAANDGHELFQSALSSSKKTTKARRKYDNHSDDDDDNNYKRSSRRRNRKNGSDDNRRRRGGRHSSNTTRRRKEDEEDYTITFF